MKSQQLYMSTDKRDSSSLSPLFSVIISVHNDWLPLEKCLESLAQQSEAHGFEVVVVDDGSDHAPPDYIHESAYRYPLTIVRQAHAGIPTARNLGIQVSKGAILVFTDADCRLEPNCLARLGGAIASSRNGCFQLHLVGDCSGIVGQAEELRLSMLQNQMLQPGGCIRYLNTAGFAIRRERVNVERGLFDPAAFRAEDTLLLSNLMQNAELPLFVRTATVQHAIPLSFISCLKKDIRSGYLEAKTFLKIARMGVRVRVSQGERFRMLRSAWKASRHTRSAWFVLICRQLLRRTVALVWRLFHSSKLRLWFSLPEEVYCPGKIRFGLPNRKERPI